MSLEWFESWFDSQYYHLLYRNHDNREAQVTIDKLISTTSLGSRPPQDQFVLDLACGKGRHAIFLAEKNYQVTGIDISASSIAYARQFEKPNLSFFQHDMRIPFRTNYFDVVFNFFTSFGYFETNEEHQEVFDHISSSLKSKGQFVLDYLNSDYVRQHIVAEEEKVVDNISFYIKRRTDEHFVYKTVNFVDSSGEKREYTERVRLFTFKELQLMAEQVGMSVEHTYGDYTLNEFHPSKSQRLIIIFKK